MGSGKSTLLLGLLNLLHKKAEDGIFKINGSVAYCSQTPYLENKSILDNILFGQDFDEKKFHQALHCADIDKDIENLPDKWNTIVGDKGTTLSGGQKSRMCIARAIYSDSDIYLFDNVLASVDPVVYSHIIERTFLGLLKEKIRIIVTSNEKILSVAHRIYVVKDGAIVDYGGFAELYNRNELVQEICSKNPKSQLKESIEDVAVDNASANNLDDDKGSPKNTSDKPTVFNKNAYWLLIKHIGIRYCAIFLIRNFSLKFCLVLIILNLAVKATNYTIGNLIDSIAGEDASFSSTPILSYVISFAIYILVSFLFPMVVALATIDTAKRLHKDMLHSVLHSPFDGFFSKISAGTILNRFTQDISMVDIDMSFYLENVLSCSSFTIVSLIFCVYVMPVFIFVIPIFGYLLFYFQRMFVPKIAWFSKTSTDKSFIL